ncbi:hypothetical protein ACFS7Z_08715 [Pontibacter toksunensis]|uniref:Uncharacterized protein n=1 Tax=Pontibacter toksunensis TaxID=1332631 RepID=A0ABW6BWN6_9BACT
MLVENILLTKEDIYKIVNDERGNSKYIHKYLIQVGAYYSYKGLYNNNGKIVCYDTAKAVSFNISDGGNILGIEAKKTYWIHLHQQTTTLNNDTQTNFELPSLTQEDLKDIYQLAKTKADKKIKLLQEAEKIKEQIENLKIEEELNLIIKGEKFVQFVQALGKYACTKELAENIHVLDFGERSIYLDKQNYTLSLVDYPAIININWSDYERKYSVPETFILPKSNSYPNVINPLVTKAFGLALERIQTHLEKLFTASELSFKTYGLRLDNLPPDNHYRKKIVVDTRNNINKTLDDAYLKQCEVLFVEHGSDYKNWDLEKVFVLNKIVEKKTSTYKVGDDNRETTTTHDIYDLIYCGQIIRERTLNQLLPSNKIVKVDMDYYYSELKSSSKKVLSSTVDNHFTMVVRNYIQNNYK